jgi:hypothetical protein
VRIKLQEQPFQILQALLERPGEVVTREELRQRIWAADTFVDFDRGLYNAVKRLREALGDSAENPRFIETQLWRPIMVADAYARAGDREKTWQWLQKAAEMRDFQLGYPLGNPSGALVKLLRSDARFQELIRRLRPPQ